MSILASIKGERKLSFNHWRYRILHWCFKVSDPDPNYPAGTGLPKFLYTHYCPLFHLTNLIAILSPLILFIRISTVVIKAAIKASFSIDWSKLAFLVSWIKLPEKKAKPEPTKEEWTDIQRDRAIKACLIAIRNTQAKDFDSFYFETTFLTKEEIKELYNKYMPKVLEARERAKLRKEQVRQQLIFWTNFSRVFIKWAMNILYIGLVICLMYAVYVIAGPVWDVICWIGGAILWLFTNEGSLEFLSLIGKTLLFGSIFIVVIYGLTKIGWTQKFCELCINGFVKITAPLYVFKYLFDWIGNGFKNIHEFVTMFYEENCPPIKIISNEEAIIENIVEQEGN
jgi:hypothetical protein